jgi:hypothetical protein
MAHSAPTGVQAGDDLGVCVPDEEAQRADPIVQIHGQVASGLSDPLTRRGSGHPQDVHSASAHLDYEQRRKPAQQDHIEGDEIADQQDVGRGRQECPTTRCLPAGAPGHCRGRAGSTRTVESLS